MLLCAYTNVLAEPAQCFVPKRLRLTSFLVATLVLEWNRSNRLVYVLWSAIGVVSYAALLSLTNFEKLFEGTIILVTQCKIATIQKS